MWRKSGNMSINTIIKIGKILYLDNKNIKDFNYFFKKHKLLLKNNKNEITTTFLNLPIKYTKDNCSFFFDFDNLSLIPENQRNELYYLNTKVVKSDSSSKKYYFGDIYYKRILKKDKDKKNNYEENGNYLFNLKINKKKSNKNVAKEETIEDKNCSFTSMYDNKKETKKTKVEKNILIENWENAFKENKDKINYILNYNFNDDNYSIEEHVNIILANFNVLNLNYEVETNIYIHFQFDNIEIENEIYNIIIDKLKKEIIEVKNDIIVLSKTIYETLCSGDDKNDLQFPNFTRENSFKSFHLNNENLNYFLTGISYYDKIYVSLTEHIIIKILPISSNLSADKLISFIDKKDENRLKNKDLFWGFDEQSSINLDIRFDLIFQLKGQNTNSNLLEIQGMLNSQMYKVKDRINNIKFNLQTEYSYLYSKKINEYISLLKLIGNIKIDEKKDIEFNENKLFEKYYLKIIPLIYNENYYFDFFLIIKFNQQIQNCIRQTKSDYKNIAKIYNQILYSLIYIIKIQNNKIDKYMELQNNKNYKVGYLLGKFTQPLCRKINNFEKKYLGFLSRNLATIDVCIKFKNEIHEMLLRNDCYIDYKSNLNDEILEIEKEYNKDLIVFGFLSGYYKYKENIINDDFDSLLKKIEYMYDKLENEKEINDDNFSTENINKLDEILKILKP